jgi:hypothetical protein
VLQVAAVWQLDVCEADVEPLVFVQRLLAVHGPAHARQYPRPASEDLQQCRELSVQFESHSRDLGDVELENWLRASPAAG